MGWGRFLLLGDLGQQLDLTDQRRELASLRAQLRSRRRAAHGVEQRLDELQSENDELRLYVAATVRLLISKGVVTREEVQEFVDVIDAEDGTADGKYSGDIA